MKFIKVATIASVAAMTASGAFAGAGTAAIEGALSQINGAYEAVGGNFDTSTVPADLADLIYFVDNTGAVSGVTFEGAGIDENGDFMQGELTISRFDYSAEIEDSKNAVIGGIKTDMFGSATATAADLVISEADDVWSVSGVTGFVADYATNGVVVDLNMLEAAIDLGAEAMFDTGSLLAIDLAASAVVSAGEDLDAKVTAVETAYGASTNTLASTRDRSASEGEYTITHGEVSHVERAHVGKASYVSLVDNILD